MEKLKKKTWKNVGVILCLVAVCSLIAIVVFLLTSEKRVETVATAETLKMTGLVCEKQGNDNEYFNKEKVVASGKHMIRANFNDDKLVDLMYAYEATYNNGANVMHLKDVAEANFNLDYGNRYVYKDNLWTSTFNVDKDDNLVKMSVYAGAESLDSNVAKVFQLGRDSAFPKTESAMKAAYENVGFTCKSS